MYICPAVFAGRRSGRNHSGSLYVDCLNLCSAFEAIMQWLAPDPSPRPTQYIIILDIYDKSDRLVGLGISMSD